MNYFITSHHYFYYHHHHLFIYFFFEEIKSITLDSKRSPKDFSPLFLMKHLSSWTTGGPDVECVK